MSSNPHFGRFRHPLRLTSVFRVSTAQISRHFPSPLLVPHDWCGRKRVIVAQPKGKLARGGTHPSP